MGVFRWKGRGELPGNGVVHIRGDRASCSVGWRSIRHRILSTSESPCAVHAPPSGWIRGAEDCLPHVLFQPLPLELRIDNTAYPPDPFHIRGDVVFRFLIQRKACFLLDAVNHCLNALLEQRGGNQLLRVRRDTAGGE